MAGEVVNVALVPLITGLVEVAKRSGLPERYAALVSLGCGLLLCLAAQLAIEVGARPLYEAALQGLLAGLTASGLYSVARAVTREPRRAHASGRACRRP